MAASVRPQPFRLEDVTVSSPLSKTMKTEWAIGPLVLSEYEGQLAMTDLAADEGHILVPKEIFAEAGVVRAQMSADKQYVLLAYDAEEDFRHAARARYMAYPVTDENQNIVEGGREYKAGDSKAIEIGGGERLQLAKWGTRGSQLVYVYKNNIYYLSWPGAEPIQITSDGVPWRIFNGIFKAYGNSWSHPVDTVGRNRFLAFSPDGSKLLFGRTNVSLEDTDSFMYYGRPGALENQYAYLIVFPYPKAGRPIGTVALKVATLPSDSSPSVNIQELLAPVDIISRDHYLETMAWANDTTVLACWTNRTGNVRQDVTYFVSSDLKEIPGEKGLKIEQKNGWVPDVDVPEFQRGSQNATYLTILWQPHDENVSFPHVVKVEGNSTKAITSGELTVTEIYGWASNGTVYYEATEAGRPSTRQVYAVEEDGEPRCLSCALTSPEGNACRRAIASFSDDFSWFSLSCLGPDPRYTAILPTAAPEVNENTTLITRPAFREWLKARQMPEIVDDWAPGSGLDVQVRLLVPPDLDPEGSEKRPAIVSVNGFPGTQQVDDTFTMDLFTYLVTYRRYVVIYIDGSGSGCKGDKTLFSVYRRLGTVEVEEQIDVTMRLAKRYPFIDSSRIGITGRGYGGYVAAMALARDDDNVFKCGVSVAPITSWIYANAAISERYMGLPTPEDNEAGYNGSDVTRLAARLAGKRFLLMHGTADDAFLFQNSMALAEALQEAGVLFQQQTYPDESHLMMNRNGHEYRTIDDFFLRCFDQSALLVEIIKELISSSR